MNEVQADESVKSRGGYKEYLRSDDVLVPKRTAYEWSRSVYCQHQSEHSCAASTLECNSQRDLETISPTEEVTAEPVVEVLNQAGGDEDDMASNNTISNVSSAINDVDKPDENMANFGMGDVRLQNQDAEENLFSDAEEDLFSDLEEDLFSDSKEDLFSDAEEALFSDAEEDLFSDGEVGDVPIVADDINQDVDDDEGQDDEEQPLHPGTNLTKSQFYLLFMELVFRHKTSGQALQDWCTLLNLLLPGIILKSKYLFMKALSKFRGTCHTYIYCGDCLGLIGCQGQIQDAGKCDLCEADYCTKDSIRDGKFFLTVPVEEQLRTVMQHIDCITLLKKSDARRSIYTDVVSGNMIQDLYKAGKISDDDLTILWNIDGVPLFKSSNFSVTPVQFTINELPYNLRKKHILMYGLWFGRSKPKAGTFLKPLIDEVEKINKNGFQWRASTGRVVNSRVFFLTASCDSVARPSVRNTIQFNGAFGCDWCLHEGVRVEKGNGYVRCYPQQQPQPDARNAGLQEEVGIEAEELGETIQGVKGVTLLSLLPHFDVVNGFVVDYMHCVLLGVTRQFATLWFDSCNNEKLWYIGTYSANVDKALMAIKPPNEITRAARSITERKYWKASEWRTFLLFYSPIILKGLLKDDKAKFYNHWMLLVWSVHSLLKSEIRDTTVVKVNAALSTFVELVSTLYGDEYVSFNVHQLVHLGQSVRNWGPLWATSAFPFEGNNQVLLGLVKGKTNAPKQIVSKFALKLKMLAHCEEIMNTAVEEARVLHVQLLHTGRYLPVKETKLDGVYLYGKSSIKSLSVTNKAALERALRKRIPPDRKFRHYLRFSNGRFMCSSSSYSGSRKRQNDLLLLRDGSLCKVNDLVVVAPECGCESVGCRDCLPESYPVILMQKLHVHQRSFFTAQRLRITWNDVLQVQGTAETLAVTVNEVEAKCFAVNTVRNEFAISMPNYFETD